VNLGGHVEEHGAHLGRVRRDAVLLGKLVVGLLALGGDHAAVVATIHTVHWLVHVTIGLSENAHDHGTGTVSALVLAEVVRARELLAAVGALERLVVGVEGAVVALEVFLAAEAAGAECADEGLGRVLGEGLLAATARGVATLRSANSGLRGLGALAGSLRNLHSRVLGRFGGLVEVGRGIALLAALALRFGDSGSGVLRDRVLRGGGREAAAGELLIAEALFAEETVVLDKARGNVKTLTLAAVEVNGLGAGVGGKARKLILNVELKGKLERGEAEVGEVCGVGDHGLSLVHVGLHQGVILLGSRESRERGVLNAANAKVPGVANLVLGDDRSGDRRRRRREALNVAGREVVRPIDRVGARLKEDGGHGWGTSPVTASEDLREDLLFAALLDGRVGRHHRVVEENSVGGCGHQAT
jgi:hypothetical protein